MDFEWSIPWTIAALICYLLVMWVVYVLVTETFSSRARQRKVLTVAWLASLVLINLGMLSYASETRDATPRVHDVSRALGLVSGQPYKVVLGERVQGSVGEGTFYGGLFSSRGTVSLQPGSSVSMGFAHKDTSYILELPVNRVSFVDSKTDRTEVQLFLKNPELRQGFGEVKQTATCGDIYVSSLVLWRDCTKSMEYTPPDAVARRGLAPIVAEYFDSATISLSSELYEQFLGSP